MEIYRSILCEMLHWTCLYILVLCNNCIKCTFYLYLIICEDCKHTRFRFTCIMKMLLTAFSSLLMFYTVYLHGVVYIS